MILTQGTKGLRFLDEPDFDAKKSLRTALIKNWSAAQLGNKALRTMRLGKADPA